VLYQITDALARMLAPILVFTADEIWENLPAEGEQRAASVHIAKFPVPGGEREADLAENWKRLFEIRDVVLRALEEERVAKTIGSSLEAKVELGASGDTFQFLKKYETGLRYLFIVSQVVVSERESGDLQVAVTRADGQKCERCWNYSTRVGEFEHYPTVCERCAAALAEIEAGAE
jgi:isoleucyl-tRNA synthetase